MVHRATSVTLSGRPHGDMFVALKEAAYHTTPLQRGDVLTSSRFVAIS